MKKHNLIVVLAALAMAVMAAPASAQVYLGIGVGASNSTGGNTSGTVNGVTFTTTGFDSWKTSWGVNGGYQFTPEWGVELQYTDLGSRSGAVVFGAPINGTAPTNTFKSYQVGLSGTYTYAFNQQWFARGKLGVSSNHTDSINGTVTTGGGTGFIAISSGSKTDVLAGVGIGLNWNKNISTRLEYEYFGKFIDTAGISSKGQNVAVKLQYNF